jgi:serine/threonine-protein kinase RsbW
VTDALEQWSAPVDAGRVELATSEVVTNALVHAEGDVALTVRLDEHSVRVEVADENRMPPIVRRVASATTSGRGMNLVEAVTDTWGVEEVPDDGKVVWFTVAARNADRDASAKAPLPGY